MSRPTGSPTSSADAAVAGNGSRRPDPGDDATERSPWWLQVLHRLLEVVLGVVLYNVYAILRNDQGRGQPGARATGIAERHGFDVLALERHLHVDVEHVLQSAVLAMPDVVIRTANVYYASVHLPLTALVFVWLLVRRPHVQAAWRNVLVVGTALALAGFALFPTMPPRLLPGARYVDTLPVHGGLWSQHAPVLEHVAHPYAAMPSLHLVWALWAGVALYRWARWAWLRRAGLLHVAITSVVVVVTGNHWVLDIVAGAAVFALALTLARAPAWVARQVSDAPARRDLVKAA